MVRPPLAKSDDGSGNRYPVRIIDDPAPWTYCWRCDKTHRTNACSSNPNDVPAALQVETPERHEPPCLGDES